MVPKNSPQSMVLEHRRDADGCYRMLVLTDVSRFAEGDPDPEFLRSFEWGPLPIVPDAMIAAEAQARYAEIHQKRPKKRRGLLPGEPFVTEQEYVYLQVCEAMDTIEVERKQAAARSKKLGTEGTVF